MWQKYIKPGTHIYTWTCNYGYQLSTNTCCHKIHYQLFLHFWKLLKRFLSSAAVQLGLETCQSVLVWEFVVNIQLHLRLSPAEVGGHHAVHVDPIAELQSDGHGEPAGAQPRVGNLPADIGRPHFRSVWYALNALY